MKAAVKCSYTRGADKSLARPGRENPMFLSEGGEFFSAPGLAGGGGELDDSSRLDVVQMYDIVQGC